MRISESAAELALQAQRHACEVQYVLKHYPDWNAASAFLAQCESFRGKAATAALHADVAEEWAKRQLQSTAKPQVPSIPSAEELVEAYYPDLKKALEAMRKLEQGGTALPQLRAEVRKLWSMRATTIKAAA